MGNQAPPAGASELALSKIQGQLQALREQLPHPHTLDEAYLLVDLASFCLARLDLSLQPPELDEPLEFWLGLDADSTESLKRQLGRADGCVTPLANDLYDRLATRGGEEAK